MTVGPVIPAPDGRGLARAGFGETGSTAPASTG